MAGLTPPILGAGGSDVLAVSSRAWSELLHAQVGTLLGRAGVPCLHIKGPTVATWQALYSKGERSWGDVDILLPPSGMDRALEVLLASGFSHRDPGLRWRTSEDHALTLWHDPDGTAAHGAAAEVDVHHRFQGMEGDPESAFAELWRRREPARLAELDVWFPDLPSRSLVLVLNAARDPAGAKAREDLRRLLATDSDTAWRRTIALARRVDALQALRAGVELEPAGHDLVARTPLADVEVSAAWRLRSQGSSRTAVRIEELRGLGVVAKVRTVAAWVVPSPAVVRYRDPRAAENTWRLVRAYADRYADGIAGLRQSVRELRAMRRQQTRVQPTDPVASEKPVDQGEPEPPTVAATTSSPAPTSPVAHPGNGPLVVGAAALVRPDGSVVLLCDQPGSGASAAVARALRERAVLLADRTSSIDPDTLEVLAASRPAGVPDEPLETRLLVFLEHDPDAAVTHVEALSGSQAAYLVGCRSAQLGDVTGGPLPALARLARRVPAYRLRYEDAARAAREVLRLWPTP
jgi:hypothetical protein